MPLQEQSVVINFSQGLETKSDPNQVPVGKFVRLVNSVFDKLGRLTKRNGYELLPALPDTSSRFVTTFNGNLTAIGGRLQFLTTTGQGLGVWTNKGILTPIELSTIPLIRNNVTQTHVDTAISATGYVCMTYIESSPSGSTTASVTKYSVADATTGQNIIPPTPITSAAGVVQFGARVFAQANNFVIVFSTASASANFLQYFTINTIVPTSIGSVGDVSSNYLPVSGKSFDGVIVSGNIYLSWASSTGVRAAFLNASLSVTSSFIVSSNSATTVSVTADTSGSTTIWTSSYSPANRSGFIVSADSDDYSNSLSPNFTAKQFVSSGSATVLNMAMTAQYGSAQLLYELENSYSYTPVATNFINKQTSDFVGSLSAASVVVRSVGLASKGFLIGSDSYYLTVYDSTNQATFFLINSTGGVVSKLAAGNAGGYLTQGLPSVDVNDTRATVGYLFKDQITAVNKDTGIGSQTQSAGIYSQKGVGLSSFKFGSSGLFTTEIGNNLHINGGILNMYDGYRVVEHGFNLYPDDVIVQANAIVGSMSSGTYFYTATYEWTDNQGNIFRSAPSIPKSIVVSAGTGSVNVNIPTLRLTQKIDNPVKIVIYRWNEGQQIYYQTTSVTSPVINSTTMDSILITDYSSNAAIIGNSILYTNGGVVENIAAPACTGMTIFDSRLWLIDSEDKNLLWYSKQVIEGVPVEMSDLFTVFVSPTISAQGSTGPMRVLAPMDDKLIIFKDNAIYYINGSGPDNAGFNSQYSQPTLITSTVGCDNQRSVVITPNGVMFQSDKGIWLLGRDLSTSYVGADVEIYNSSSVLSALTVPGTNQVRFTLDNGITLLYDYYVKQWGSFEGISALSSTLYQGKHTFINPFGQVLQEAPGTYLDGSNPVLMSFTTGFLNFDGLQGYRRVYSGYMLGGFRSPHRLTVGMAYDYDSSVTQLASIIPDNYSGTWGSGTSWGSVSLWGGNSAREQWQINFERQQCQSFQLSFNEFSDYRADDLTYAGLTISGFKITYGIKSGSPKNIGVSNKVG